MLYKKDFMGSRAALFSYMYNVMVLVFEAVYNNWYNNAPLITVVPRLAITIVTNRGILLGNL